MVKAFLTMKPASSLSFGFREFVASGQQCCYFQAILLMDSLKSSSDLLRVTQIIRELYRGELLHEQKQPIRDRTIVA